MIQTNIILVSKGNGALPGMHLAHAVLGCNGLLHRVKRDESEPSGAAALTDEL